jgi:hypothetical protein
VRTLGPVDVVKVVAQFSTAMIQFRTPSTEKVYSVFSIAGRFR